MKFNLRSAAIPASVLIALSAGCAPAATGGGENDRSVVTAADIEQHPGQAIELIIQRRVPGVIASKADDGGYILQIRGSQTLLGDPKPPLYVVDGLVRDAALRNIDARDIELIRVLKGTDASIYGIDGANGVIVITTKAGGGRK